MDFIATEIPEVILIKPNVFGDERGFFMETWEKSKFAEAGISTEFVQDNHSRSTRGILRGIHYQIRQPQGKLVRVTRGSVFDVAVDLRQSSPTFGQWVGMELSDENQRLLWVPPGFGHAFFVTSESADFVYKCTEFYAPEYERTIIWNDAQLGIEWPKLGRDEPVLSAKDGAGKAFCDAEHYE